MIADFADQIADPDFAAPNVVLRRTAAGSMANGRYTAGATADTALVAVVTRGAGELVELLPEGERTKEAITVYTSEIVYPVIAPAGYVADKIVYKGEVFEVQQVQDWSDNGNFYVGIATKVAA